METLPEALLIDVSLFLVPGGELEIAGASRDLLRAAETAARVMIRETYAPLCDVGDDGAAAPTWRGLAACWAKNVAWLRATARDLGLERAADGGAVATWKDALRRGPAATARVADGQAPAATGGDRAERPRPRRQTGLVLETGRGVAEGVAVVVASAAGDCTIFDAASDDGAQRLELCHGYPSPATDAARPRIALFQPARRTGAAATVHRGKTRSTGAVRVYTVALRRAAGPAAAPGDGAADLVADVFVDGARELAAAPLAQSRGFADRVVLGADHLGRWPLRGVIHDFALFAGRVPAAFVRGVERALAAEHGVPMEDDDDAAFAETADDVDDDDADGDEPFFDADDGDESWVDDDDDMDDAAE